MSESESDDLVGQTPPSASDPPVAAPVADHAAAPVAATDEIFWGWHDFFLFLFIAMISLGVALLAGSGIRQLFHLSEARTNIVMIVFQFAAYGVAFLGLKLMFLAEYGEPLLASLHWRTSATPPGTLALIGLGQAFAIAIFGSFLKVPQTENPMSRLMADRPTAIVVGLLAVTLAPVAEELAFRGLLQPLLVRTIGAIPGILVTAVLFGFMHFEQYATWQSVLLVALAGAGFGLMRHRTGSTRSAAIMHAGYNSALFILVLAQKGPSH